MEQGRIAVGGRHLKCQRRLKPSGESGRREESWPVEREQKPPPHGGLTHFACSTLEHIGPVMEQTPLNSAISSVTLRALPVCSQESQLSLAAHTVLLQ